MSERAPNPQVRNMVAAHELGHALAWHHSGVPVVSIRLRGEHAVSGWVEVSKKAIPDEEGMRSFLIGVLAGRVAGERWRDQHRLRDLHHDCDFDRTLYRRYRRKPLAEALSDGELKAAARVAVSRHWREIERLVPALAARGTMRL